MKCNYESKETSPLRNRISHIHIFEKELKKKGKTEKKKKMWVLVW